MEETKKTCKGCVFCNKLRHNYTGTEDRFRESLCCTELFEATGGVIFQVKPNREACPDFVEFKVDDPDRN